MSRILTAAATSGSGRERYITMKKSLKPHITALLVCLLIPATASLLSGREEGIGELKSLRLNNNELLKTIREDVRKTVFAIKGKRSTEQMPQLKFYKYRIKERDTFWTILSRTNLDIDSLMTVNDLSSPGSIKPGRTIYITNMRGILLENKTGHELNRILRQYKIKREYVEKANGNLDKNYLFVPCGEVSRLERSLFLGTGFMSPLSRGRRTSGFGTRRDPFNSSRYEFHGGIDLACPMKTPVMASRDGTVSFSGYRGGYGNLVVISHEHGYSSMYGHLSRSLVVPGQKVKRGDIIALSGNTGRTTGPHLHFEVHKGKRAVNPGILIRQ